MATRTINYASGATALRPSVFQNLPRLFSPANLAVMFAVFCMHVLLWPVLFITFFGIFFFIVAIPVLGALILAHYGNVIEDAGPFENDELPRPLRNLGFYDDIWSPFCNVFASMIICYGPCAAIFAAAIFQPKVAYFGAPLLVGWGALGTLLFPAILLTLQAGGTILNLRPDRVMAVIAVSGFNYFVAVLLWVATALFYFVGWVGSTLALANLAHDTGAPDFLISWIVILPALVLGIFLAHWFCVWLGRIYRAYFDKFPWVLQRHVSTRVRKPPPPGAPQPRRGRSIRPIPNAQRPLSGPDA